MKKKSIVVALAGALLAPAAFAEEAAAAAPASPLTFNVGVVSDYLFRGVSQTRGKPALSAGIDYAHESGFYVGAWASSITWVKDWLGSGSTEIDVYGGYKGAFASPDWTYDVGIITYNYSGSGASTRGSAVAFSQLAKPDTTEVYASIGYKWLSVKYSQAISTNFIGWAPMTATNTADLSKNSRGSNYLEVNASYDLGDGWGISGHVGNQKVKNVIATTYGPDANYTDWNIGVTKDTGYGVVGLTYSTTNAKGNCPASPPAAGNTSAYCWGAGMNTANPTGFKDVAQGTAVLSYKYSF